MDSSTSRNMKEVERRERQLWVLVFGLILVLSGFTVTTYFTLVDEAYPIFSIWRTVSYRVLGGLCVLIFLFCAYVVQTRKIIGRMRSDQESQAMLDHLTDLCNRRYFNERLNEAIARAARNRNSIAILLFDLDNFKAINDALGHSEGDNLLKDVVNRMKKHIRTSDVMARHGGDEFAILMQDLQVAENITKVIERIFLEFKKPFILKGQEFFITISMGISFYPNDGDDAEILLKNVDIAMYMAKEEGRNTYKFFTTSMNDRITKKINLENKLRRAIEQEQFVLHYQPQVDIHTGEAIGIEALVRWQEPDAGLIPPADFIPLAEESGLIVPIGEWVLRTACTQNKLWQDRGLSPLCMAVNVSMRQFKRKDFIDTVKRILKETKLDPKYLELEMTESILMDDMELTIEMLRELKTIGLRLSIDDFGTGYSSLEYLKKMPIDMLKIAQVFVRDITTDTNDAAIVRATIHVAQSMKLEVLAEGVETIEHLKLLRTLECDKIQGFLVSRPLPSEEVEDLLKKEYHFLEDRKVLASVSS